MGKKTKRVRTMHCEPTYNVLENILELLGAPEKISTLARKDGSELTDSDTEALFDYQHELASRATRDWFTEQIHDILIFLGAPKKIAKLVLIPENDLTDWRHRQGKKLEQYKLEFLAREKTKYCHLTSKFPSE